MAQAPRSHYVISFATMSYAETNWLMNLLLDQPMRHAERLVQTMRAQIQAQENIEPVKGEENAPS